MSFHSYFSISALPEDQLGDYYNCFRNQPNSVVPDTLPPLPKSLSAFSRSDWYPTACKVLLDLTKSHEKLRFLSREIFTHTKPTMEDMPDWDMQITLIKQNDVEVVLGELKSLLGFCHNHPDPVAEAINKHFPGHTAENIISAMNEARVCNDLSRESPYSEEGDSVEFVFTVLLSFQALLEFALAHGFAVTYGNITPK